MPTTDRKLHVFLCHASQDKPVVRELYQRLAAEDWIDPWLDKDKILPGQQWQVVIEKAVECADIVIVFLSNHSVQKEGFVQRELRYASVMALEKPESTIFLIPVRTEDCPAPRSLRDLQWVNYFGNEKDASFENLLQALRLRHQQVLEHEQSELKHAEAEARAKREAEEHARLELEIQIRKETEATIRAEYEAREKVKQQTEQKHPYMVSTIKPPRYEEKPTLEVTKQDAEFYQWLQDLQFDAIESNYPNIQDEQKRNYWGKIVLEKNTFFSARSVVDDLNMYSKNSRAVILTTVLNKLQEIAKDQDGIYILLKSDIDDNYARAWSYLNILDKKTASLYSPKL
jgi:hypothetical protein